MRISDWSSDVCSSDLPVGRFPQQPGPHPIAFIGIEILAGINVADESVAALDRPRDAQRGGVAERDVERALDVDLVLVGIGEGRIHAVEIGRASGRESVCQYV